MLKSFDTGTPCREPALQLLGQWLVRQGKLVAGDLRNIPRYLLRTLIGVAVVCGLVCLWAAHGDGKLPGMAPLSGLDPYCISSARCIADETTAEARWNGLSPTLAILDKVNPAVAEWVRAKHGDGLVVFGDEYRTKGDPINAQAKYDRFRDRLIVYRELFCENDGAIAIILCHEYRHSRQNFGKFCQYVLSSLFVRGDDLSMIENDPIIYEHEAHDAIFGDGRSREKELAAWERSAQDRISRHIDKGR